MQNLKFRIESPEHSKAIQEKLFEMGCRWDWMFTKINGLVHVTKPFLFLCDNIITFEDNEWRFNDNENTEAFLINGEIVTKEQMENKMNLEQEIEALKATQRVKEEQEHISDILKTLKDDHDIPPKVSRKIISAMRKGNGPEIKEENEMFDDLFEITV